MAASRSHGYAYMLCKHIVSVGLLTTIDQGLTHRVIQDDTYNGYRIPKGSSVWANIYAIGRDEEVYPDPEKFLPEHFLPPDQGGTLPAGTPDFAEHVVFGFGRRLCPARPLGLSSLWLTCASVLAAFDICHMKDANGEDVEVTAEYVTEGANWCVLPLLLPALSHFNF